MTCKDVMTQNPKSCIADDTVRKAAQIMRDEDVGSIPVVRDRTSNKVAGIITDRDIAIHVLAAGRNPESTRVGEVMAGQPIMCRVDDSYSEALARMSRHQVRRIPITNPDGSLAGIISQADVARMSSEGEAGQILEDISEPAGMSHFARSSRSRSSDHAEKTGLTGAGSALIGAACLAVGAGVMFLLDPVRGRARRAKLRDKASSLYSDSTYYAGKIQRDVRNRATGAVACAKSKLTRSEDVADQKLEARIRSGLGRTTSHPHAIRVRAEHGHITLEGNIMVREVGHVVSSVRSVSGVTGIDNRLHMHEEAGNISELQGGVERHGPRSEFLQSNWSPTARLVASAIGGGLVIYGLRTHGAIGKATATMGAGLITRGVSNRGMNSWSGISSARQALGI